MAKVITSTKNMDKLAWLQHRQKGIGGSDAGGILGVSQYKTPFGIYMDKTEVITEETEAGEAAYWGNELEDLVAKEFTKRTGKKVRKKNQLLQHDEHEFMVANLDRDIVGEKAFLECKTTGAFGAKEWDGDEIPAAYLVQIMHYMAVTGDEKAYIAVLIGGQKFLWKEIPRDEELITMIIEAEKDFWYNHIIPGQPPRLDGSTAAEKYLAERYKVAEPGKIIDLTSDYAGRIGNLAEIKETIKQLEEKQKEIENNIKEEMKDAEIALTPQWQVSWKSVKRSTVDSKKLKAEYADIYKAVLNESTSRRFTIKEIKEDTEV